MSRLSPVSGEIGQGCVRGVEPKLRMAQPHACSGVFLHAAALFDLASRPKKEVDQPSSDDAVSAIHSLRRPHSFGR
jgi:hypothetical protein